MELFEALVDTYLAACLPIIRIHDGYPGLHVAEDLLVPSPHHAAVMQVSCSYHADVTLTLTVDMTAEEATAVQERAARI